MAELTWHIKQTQRYSTGVMPRQHGEKYIIQQILKLQQPLYFQVGHNTKTYTNSRELQSEIRRCRAKSLLYKHEAEVGQLLT